MAIKVYAASPTDLRVRVPIPGHPNPNIVAEWQFVPAADGCWSIDSLTAVDVTAVQPSVVLSPPGDSIYEYAFQIGYAADAYNSGVTYDFFGPGGHGHESPFLALQFMADGLVVNYPATGIGSAITCTNFIISESMRVGKPVGTDAGSVIGNEVVTYIFAGNLLRVDHTVFITGSGLDYRTAYGAMLPGNPAVFDRASADATIIPIHADNSIPLTGLKAKLYQFFNSDTSTQPLRVQMDLVAHGLPEYGGSGWSLSAPPGAWFYDRAYPKWYVNWVADAKTPAVNSQHTQTYTVSYQL